MLSKPKELIIVVTLVTKVVDTASGAGTKTATIPSWEAKERKEARVAEATAGGENNHRKTGGIIWLKIMVMKVWYLQVIWQVRDSIIKKAYLAMANGKTMIRWRKNSGEKEPDNSLKMLRVNNQRKIKKLPMNSLVQVPRTLRLQHQKENPQIKLKKQMMAEMVVMVEMVVMELRKKVLVMEQELVTVQQKLMLEQAMVQLKKEQMLELVQVQQKVFHQNSIPL